MENKLPRMGTKGIFDIFVPGLFLLINLIVIICILPLSDNEIKKFISSYLGNPLVSFVIIASFAYLIGVILRLFPVGLTDKISQYWIKKFHKGAANEDGSFKLWAEEPFPYIKWIGFICKNNYPSKVYEFYEKIWAPMKREQHTTNFFNLIKVIINSNNEKSSIEIYSAEHLTRYMSGMFYALSLAIIALFFTIIINILYLGKINWELIIILFIYTYAIKTIISRIRFVRIKEVETVFAASFANAEILLKLIE